MLATNVAGTIFDYVLRGLRNIDETFIDGHRSYTLAPNPVLTPENTIFVWDAGDSTAVVRNDRSSVQLEQGGQEIKRSGTIYQPEEKLSARVEGYGAITITRVEREI